MLTKNKCYDFYNLVESRQAMRGYGHALELQFLQCHWVSQHRVRHDPPLSPAHPNIHTFSSGLSVTRIAQNPKQVFKQLSYFEVFNSS